MKLNSNDIKRFWEKTKLLPNGCIVWTASKHYKGYGQFSLKGKYISAHRASYLIHYGELPKGLFVCHHCDNPPCVNPDHLFIGTHQDNVDDREAKGRNKTFNGENHPMALLTEVQVSEIKGLLPTMTNVSIARLYGVSGNCISHIRCGDRWANVKSPKGE